MRLLLPIVAALAMVAGDAFGQVRRQAYAAPPAQAPAAAPVAAPVPQIQPVPPKQKYLTGAFASPRHKLLSTPKFVVPRNAMLPPAYYGTIPAKLSYWGNNQWGNCVSAEEAMNIAVASVKAGMPEAVIADSDLISWCRKNGFLNGANLTDVMDSLQVGAKNPLMVNGVPYYDGPYQSVDWTDRTALCAAIFASGQVKIGVASGQLQGAVNGSNGWFLTKGYSDQSEDHCVGLVGYGTAAQCASILGVSVPSGIDSTTFGYLLFTWDTVGFISETMMKDITGEAWLRNPSSLPNGVPYVTPTPTPTPTPNPCPPCPPGPSPTPTPVPDPGPAPTPAPVVAVANVTVARQGNLQLRFDGSGSVADSWSFTIEPPNADFFVTFDANGHQSQAAMPAPTVASKLIMSVSKATASGSSTIDTMVIDVPVGPAPQPTPAPAPVPVPAPTPAK